MIWFVETFPKYVLNECIWIKEMNELLVLISVAISEIEKNRGRDRDEREKWEEKASRKMILRRKETGWGVLYREVSGC